MSRKVTIYDIAKYLRISAATVSYVLNDVPKVSEQTKKTVLKAAKELGYSRDYKAVAFSTGKTRTIFLYFPNDDISQSFLQNPFYSEFLGYFQKEVQEEDYDVVIKTMTRDKIMSKIKSRGVCCLVYIGKFPEENYLELKNSDIPVVLVDVFEEYSKYFTNVRTDDELGTYLAVKYLIDNGHRNIGFLSGDINNSIVDKRRFEGYKKAFEEFHIPLDENNLYYVDATFDNGYQISSSIMNNKNMTGLVCAADTLAIGVIKGYLHAGKKLPYDLSIVGFDDIQIDQLTSPTLTTIRQDIPRKAKEAAKIALQAIKNKQNLKIEFLNEPILVERESVKNLLN